MPLCKSNTRFVSICAFFPDFTGLFSSYACVCLLLFLCLCLCIFFSFHRALFIIFRALFIIFRALFIICRALFHNGCCEQTESYIYRVTSKWISFVSFFSYVCKSWTLRVTNYIRDLQAEHSRTIYVSYFSYFSYGVATMSRMLKNIGLFYKRALQKRPVFCKETCIFKHPTNRSHPIYCVSRELSEFRSISTRYICWVSRTGGSRGSALIVYINNKGNNIYDIYRTYCLWNEFYIVWSRGSALIVYINNIYIWHI